MYSKNTMLSLKIFFILLNLLHKENICESLTEPEPELKHATRQAQVNIRFYHTAQITRKIKTRVSVYRNLWSDD